MNLRRPLLGVAGTPLVAVLCAWELIALAPRSPVPTLSETVWRHPWFGALLLALLSHHWLIERAVDVERVLSPDNGRADALDLGGVLSGA